MRIRCIRCISVRQPWASVIIKGWKHIENRTWTTPYRGPLLIHASKTIDPEGYEQIARIIDEKTFVQFRSEHHPTGGIIGIVDLVDIVTENASPWFCGLYGWVLSHPLALPFVPYRGRQTLFEVPEEIVFAPRQIQHPFSF